MNRILKKLLAATVLAASAAAPGQALASYALQVLETGATCFDNGTCDGTPAGNIISWSTSAPGVGMDFNFSFTNAPGGPYDSHLDLNWSVLGSGGGGTVHILASATGFTFPASNGITYLNTQVGGTGSGAFGVTAQSWVDFTNTLFGMGAVTSGQIGTFTNSPFAGADAVPFLVAQTPYSITELLTITVGGNGFTTGDSQVVIPQPSTLLLLAAGLFGFCAYLRRRAS